MQLSYAAILVSLISLAVSCYSIFRRIPVDKIPSGEHGVCHKCDKIVARYVVKKGKLICLNCQ